MKIAGLLLNELSSGGGFNQALNALLQMEELCRKRFEFVVYTNKTSNLSWLKDLQLPARFLRTGWSDRLAFLSNTTPLLRPFQRTFRFAGHLERVLVRDGVDIAYFLHHQHCVAGCNG